MKKQLFFPVLILSVLFTTFISCKKETIADTTQLVLANKRLIKSVVNVTSYDYTYDAQNRLIKTVQTLIPTHTQQTVTTYDYSQPKRIIETNSNAAQKYSVRNFYDLDNNNRVVKSYFFLSASNSLDSALSSTVYTYNADGQITQEVSSPDANGIVQTSTLSYTNGNRVSDKIVNKDKTGKSNDIFLLVYTADSVVINSLDDAHNGLDFWGNSSKNALKKFVVTGDGGNVGNPFTDTYEYVFEVDSEGFISKRTEKMTHTQDGKSMIIYSVNTYTFQ